MSLKPGDVLSGGEIRIEALIGQGAFGVIYRARDTTLDHHIAVKELHRDASGMYGENFYRYGVAS